MSQIQFVEEFIREYLLFRGFSSTLKIFESDLKVDRDKGFRVDKIVEQLVQYVNTCDLNSLRELWLHLDQKIFSKLEHHFTHAVRKLENAVLKLYLVNAVVTNKPEKVMDFFNKMTGDLINQAEWKEWFMLPFIRYPEENPVFAVHFTRHWQDTLLVSLHNFLATVFQCMPLPTLCAYEEDSIRMKRLQEENEALKHRISLLMDNSRLSNTLPEPITNESTQMGSDLMDDFYVIAQEASLSSDGQNKTLKSIIRNISSGLPTSPILSRRVSQQTTQAGYKKLNSSVSTDEQPQRRPSSKRQISTPTVPSWGSNRLSPSLNPADNSTNSNKRQELKFVSRNTWESGVEGCERKVIDNKKNGQKEVKETFTSDFNGAFLLLSQEEYGEHRSSATQCKFNSTGSMVASSDCDGVIKLWTGPSPMTLATFVSKSGALSLAWVTKNERYFLSGHASGTVKLYDSRESKIVWELANDIGPLADTSILDLCCNPNESNFVCSVVNNQRPVSGKLLLYDLKTKKLEHSVLLDPSDLTATCCTFNHNGQLLFAGCNDGTVRIYDLRSSDCIDVWHFHQGSIETIQLTSDFTSCFTLARDGKMCQYSLNQNGQILWESSIPDPSVIQNIPSLHGKLFAFDPSNTYILICGPNGGNIVHIGESGMNKLLDIGGHNSPVVATDWVFTDRCASCLTASVDGKIRLSTLLTP